MRLPDRNLLAIFGGPVRQLAQACGTQEGVHHRLATASSGVTESLQSLPVAVSQWELASPDAGIRVLEPVRDLRQVDVPSGDRAGEGLGPVSIQHEPWPDELLVPLGSIEGAPGAVISKCVPYGRQPLSNEHAAIRDVQTVASKQASKHARFLRDTMDNHPLQTHGQTIVACNRSHCIKGLSWWRDTQA